MFDIMIQVTIIESRNNNSFQLKEDVTIVGRGFLNCDDRRISKNHGVLSVIESQFQIKSIHNNPIYYKHVGDQDYKTLFKDESTILKHCDKFSFLPMPNTEYEVRIEDQNSTGNFRIRQVGEINENLVNGSMSTSMSQIFGTEQNVPDTTNDYHNDPNRTPSPENLVPPASFLQNERKRSSENQESNESPAKRSKSETSEATASSSTSTTTLNVTPVKIKPDPDSTTIQQNPSTSTGIRITKIKQEPDASKMPKVKIEPPSRPSCEFGIRCYRQTPDHRRNFAHPNDSDYRRPSYPNAPPGTPPCPWGNSCYRRNPEHFKSLSHPPACVYTTSTTSAVTTNPTPILQQSNVQQNQRYNQISGRDGDNDDDSEEDSMNLNDGESDIGDGASSFDDSEADANFMVASDSPDEIDNYDDDDDNDENDDDEDEIDVEDNNLEE